jgi:hypothetical protein
MLYFNQTGEIFTSELVYSVIRIINPNGSVSTIEGIKIPWFEHKHQVLDSRWDSIGFQIQFGYSDADNNSIRK